MRITREVFFARSHNPIRADSIEDVERVSIPIDRDWLKVEEIAEFMGVSRYVVTAILRSGDLPAVKMGREWRVAKRDFEDWMNAQRGAPPV